MLAGLRKVLVFCITVLISCILFQGCISSRKPPALPNGLWTNPTIEKNLYLDGSFDADEVRLIEEAAEEWEIKSEGVLHLNIIKNYNQYKFEQLNKSRRNILLLKVHSFDTLIRLYETQYKIITLGLYFYDNNFIYLVYNRMNDKDYYRGVILHELGHSFGMPHSKTNNDNMYHIIDKNLSLTKEDLNAFCEINKCVLYRNN